MRNSGEVDCGWLFWFSKLAIANVVMVVSFPNRKENVPTIANAVMRVMMSRICFFPMILSETNDLFKVNQCCL